MPEELLIDVSPFETRVALLRDRSLREVHVERSGTYSLTGNIYRGKVERIMPGMQAAFVDVGLARPGFLHVRDIEGSLILPSRDEQGAESRVADIRDLIHQGQSVLVQVAKDPISSKGARLTTNLAIAGRYLVLLPFSRHIGVSQRIEGDATRDALRASVGELREGSATEAGLIVRTAAENASLDQLDADLRTLLRIWRRVAEANENASPGELVYEELPLHTRIIRDLASPALECVRINDRATYQRINQYVERYLPEFAERLAYFDAPSALFDQHGVETELERMLGKKVEMKSGGYLVIEQTEAMTTIDINTGAYLGNKNLEETAFRTNLEAAACIPVQLQLRNIGGLIVIDFIDLEDPGHRDAVLKVLAEAVASDPGRVRMTGFSSLGLVEMSRKRTRESFGQQMCEPCEVCQGTGLVKSAVTTCYEVLRSIQSDARRRCVQPGEGEYLVCAGEDVIERLLDEDAQHLKKLVDDIDRPVRLQVEPALAVGDFDVVLVHGVVK